ncbi:MAG: HIT family protein [Chitinophagaceae bacterium]|nr:HIT family protein [Chitinophagaceae bacterium]
MENVSQSIESCPFCNIDSDRVTLLENETVYALLDKFPVSPGHTLIIPKRHCADYFDLTFKEQSDCWLMVNETKALLTAQYHPDGYNVGINIGASAGQTIFHLHIHLIPRYTGDVEEPRGGVRGVIPLKKNY